MRLPFLTVNRSTTRPLPLRAHGTLLAFRVCNGLVVGALNPAILDDEPMLAEALRAAGFDLAVKPGTWSLTGVQIDLLVPSSLGGPGRRRAPWFSRD